MPGGPKWYALFLKNSSFHFKHVKIYSALTVTMLRKSMYFVIKFKATQAALTQKMSFK